VIVYADTSALGSVYLGDEADAAWLREILFDGHDPVVTSELADVELASLLARAMRDRRIDAPTLTQLLAEHDVHTASDGPIGIVPITRATLAAARAFALEASVRSLDALHLAAARGLVDEGEDVVILTRERRQGAAAAALGFRLHPRSTR
jgi:predicted nucleic acid-binding protein